MLKNALFLEKNGKIVAAFGAPPPNPLWLPAVGAPPPDLPVVTPVSCFSYLKITRYNFILGRQFVGPLAKLAPWLKPLVTPLFIPPKICVPQTRKMCFLPFNRVM